jgi:hypothetical protein
MWYFRQLVDQPIQIGFVNGSCFRPDIDQANPAYCRTRHELGVGALDVFEIRLGQTGRESSDVLVEGHLQTK